MIGNARDAFRAACGWWTCVEDDPTYLLHMRTVGSGEARTCWLLDGVVYKVAHLGRESANVHEHEVFTAWRAAGARWAPETSLHWVPWPSPAMAGELVPVVAMPYLPDNGDLDEATMAEIRRDATGPDLWSGNCVHHGGQTYLIDGGEVERTPASAAR